MSSRRKGITIPDEWQVGRVAFSIVSDDAGSRICRGSRALGAWSSIAKMAHWFDRVCRIATPPPPSNAFTSLYFHRLAWDAVLAHKERALADGLRRSYTAQERSRIIARYHRGDITRSALAADEAMPEGTLGRWLFDEKQRRKLGVSAGDLATVDGSVQLGIFSELD